MLIINDFYTSIDKLFKSVNETKESDQFEQRCVRFLRSKYPGHSFSLKGGRNKMTSDILVDDSLFIECKMMENSIKKNGAQSTGFGIRLDDKENKFIASDSVEDDENATKIVKYINKHFNDFKELNKSNSGTRDIDLDSNIFASYIHNYYSKKNVMFFITSYDDKLVIFKNTPGNLLKYFNIITSVRFFKNGTRDIPANIREKVINLLKKKYNATSERVDKKKTIIKIRSEIKDPYIDVDDTTIYLSKISDSSNEYRIMKVSDIGSPRVIFKIISKREQDQKDLQQFEDFINN